MQCLSVTILDDPFLESVEVLFAKLFSSDPEIDVTQQGVASILITDNDSKFHKV